MKNLMMVLVAGLLLVGCSNDRSEMKEIGHPAEAPKAEVAPELPKPLGKEQLQKVGLVLIDSKLKADISMEQLRMITLGGKIKEGPNTIPEFWATIEDRSYEVGVQYTDAIKELPQGDLRTTLKDCFAADARFYDALKSPDTSGRRWLPTIIEAKNQRDVAASKVDVELQLARN